MKLLITIILFCLISYTGFSQTEPKAIRLRGKVIDSEAKVGFGGVKIFMEGTTYGTITDAEGIFVLDYPIQIDRDSIILVCTHLGYQEQKIKLTANQSGDYLCLIGLYPTIKLLDEIIVSKKAKLKFSNSKIQLKEITLKGKVFSAEDFQYNANDNYQLTFQLNTLKIPIQVDKEGDFNIKIQNNSSKFNIGQIIITAENLPKQVIQITQMNCKNINIAINSFSFKKGDYFYQNDDEEITFFRTIDEEAEFMGGMTRFNTLIQKNLLSILKGKKISQTVLLTFNINKGGEIIDKRIIDDCENSLKELIFNAIPMEKWKPTKIIGRPKITQFVLPISFNLK
jgi:hypothetical protein